MGTHSWKMISFQFSIQRGVIFAIGTIITIVICYSFDNVNSTHEQWRQATDNPILTGFNTSFTNKLQCNCTRAESKLPFAKELSACDSYSSARGYHQKVVSYAIFGNTSSNYFQGVEQSANNVAKFYPDWVMRLYHNFNISDGKQSSDLCNLWCKYDHLDLCDAQSLPYPLHNQSIVYGTLWRFFPLGDPLVDIFIVRDLDSPILPREVDAVEDWIQRNKTFHIMRDHPYHNIPILAGMWGALNKDRVFMEKLRGQFILDGLEWVHGKDQNLLSIIVWPHAINDSVAHDSYKCESYPKSIAFPTQRENLTYVGIIYGWREGHDYPLENPCPEECRPRHHPNWEYC